MNKSGFAGYCILLFAVLLFFLFFIVYFVAKFIDSRGDKK